LAPPADHYATLKIAPDADIEVVRAAYRALMLKHHPDQNRDNPAALAQATRINAAYEVLSDPGRRAAYDRGRADARAETVPPPFHDSEPTARPRRPAPRPTPFRDALLAALVWRVVGVVVALAAAAGGGLYLEHALSSAGQTSASQFDGALHGLGGAANAPGPKVIHIQPGQVDRHRPAGLFARLGALLPAAHYSRHVTHGVAIYRREDPWGWLRTRLNQLNQWLHPRPTQASSS
jgi:hypothetical protein